MELLQYILISSFEYLSFFVFIIVQFRFSLKENISQLALISLLLSFVSYTFNDAGLNGYFPLIQFIIVLLYIQFVMKVSILNALIMFFTGYIVYGLAQTCILAAAMHLEIVDGMIVAGTQDAYFVQVVSILLMSVFSFLIVYLKGGLSFIEARSRFSRKSFTGNNRIFIIFTVIAFMITIITNINFLESDNPPLLAIALIFLIFIFVLFYLSIRRDNGNDRGSLQSTSD